MPRQDDLEASAEDAPAAPAPAARILIVDDDEEAFLVCRAYLGHVSAGGYAVSWAQSYRDGLEAALAGRYDVYVVDYFLRSAATGIDLIAEARRRGVGAPMVLLTRYGSDRVDRAALAAGATDYLSKTEITGPGFERAVRYAVERSHAERRLRESEQRYRSLFWHNPHPIYGIDFRGRIVAANPAAEALLGARAGGVLGRRIGKIVAPEARAEAVAVFRRMVDEGAQPFDLVLRRDDGVRVPVSGVSVPVEVDGALVGVYAVAQDVGERRRSEERIRFQAALLDAVGQAVIATDMGGRVRYWNEAATRLFGWSAEEAQGLDILALTPALGAGGRAAEIMEALRDGGTWSGEFQVRRKDGSEFPAHVTNALLRGPDGRPAGVVGISTDLSERKELEAQALRTTKLEAIGSLAGGIAHDFNNLLTSILGFNKLALEAFPPGDEGRGHLEEAMRSATRAQDLTRQLLAFGRQQILQPRVLDLGHTLREMERMLARTLGEDITLAVDPFPEPTWVKVDPGQAEQVVLNLAINAREAMPGGGRLSIRTGMERLGGEAPPDLGFTTEPGDYVCLRVADTGVGMSEEVLGKIFEPYFTTKQGSGGSGLGLATVYGIVKQSGGYIVARSKEGEGTTFTVYFPRVEAPAPARQAEGAGAADAPAGGGRMVLVVEDEEPVRRLVRRVLEGAGYTVLDVDSGEAALEVVRASAPAIDLILTDVVMPGINGRELVERLAEGGVRPPVIYMSGYTRDEVVRRGVARATHRFMEKPFMPEDVLRVVAEALS